MNFSFFSLLFRLRESPRRRGITKGARSDQRGMHASMVLRPCRERGRAGTTDVAGAALGFSLRIRAEKPADELKNSRFTSSTTRPTKKKDYEKNQLDRFVSMREVRLFMGR